MYKFGVAHCCCGCSILNWNNCKTEEDFNRSFEIESGSAPTFSGTVNNYYGQTATFSGNAKFLVKTNPIKDKVGVWLKPEQVISTGDIRDNITKVTYYFEQYAKGETAPTVTWKVVYMATSGLYEYLPYRVEIYRGNSKVYETEAIPCSLDVHNDISPAFRGMFNFKTLVIRNSDTKKIEFWGNVDTVHLYSDYFFYSESLTQPAYFKVHWEVTGTNWILATHWSNGGFCQLWQPEKDNADCPYPEDCSYLIGNIKQTLPQLKIWFTGFGDYQPYWYGEHQTPYKCSLLNNLECYGVAKSKDYGTYTDFYTPCEMYFSQTRWITGQLETNPDYDSAALTDPSRFEDKYLCSQRNSSNTVLLDPGTMLVSQNADYENLIDIEIRILIEKLASTSYNHLAYSDILTGVTFKGTAYKDSDGQIDLTRLNEVELLPQLPTPDDVYYDPDSISIPIFQNAVGHLAVSNHTFSEAHNKAILGTQPTEDIREIDYINLTCQIGFIGFTNVTRMPTGYEDFVQYYPTITTVLSPYGQNWVNTPTCDSADINYLSPVIQLTSTKTIQFGFYMPTGQLWINANLELIGDVPGSAAVSPRGVGNLTFGGNGCPPLAQGSFYIPGYNGFTWGGIPQTAGKFINNIDQYGNVTPMCLYPYQGNGQQIWQASMFNGYPGRAYIPDEYCNPQTDPDTYEPLYYWGGIPVMKGTIEIVYKQ